MKSDFKILQGSCLDVLKTLDSESVQCVVTSPPYFGLRDYGTAQWAGGTTDCDHRGKPFRTSSEINKHTGTGVDVKNAKRFQFFKEVCEKCGAVRQDEQIGLEKTVEEYVAKLVRVFSEVRRVLKKDGTLWLNLGDSYANDNKWGGKTGGKHAKGLHGMDIIGRGRKNTNLKPKNLIGIPWKVAFALQATGWILRQEIIWHKLNPMPEPVLDRCTKAHEYIFLLTKSPKYFFDAQAIKEPLARSSTHRLLQPNLERQNGSNDAPGKNNGAMKAVGNLIDGLRNKRSVWSVATAAYPEAHFATFPEELITPCILAGAKPGDLVADPFSGSGTTGLVAMKHGRSYVGIELNPEYIEITQRRLKDVQVNLFN